ncbi:MAG TPA: hypothetical protein VJU16_04595 [Planctomycetota bacterium]|nr:hypothetical protein [Planctomycetota bacterium]
MTGEISNLVPVTCPHCRQPVVVDMAQARVPICPACGQGMRMKPACLGRLLVMAGITVAIIVAIQFVGRREKHHGYKELFGSNIEVQPHSTFWGVFVAERSGEAHLYVQAGAQPVNFLMEAVSWQAPTQKDLDPLRDRPLTAKAGEMGSVIVPMEKGLRYGYFVFNESDVLINPHVRVRLVESLD